MKKTLLLAALVVALVALTAAPAMAGGWWDISGDLWTTVAGTAYDPATTDFEWGGDLIGVTNPDVGVRADTSKTDGWGTRGGYYGASDDNPHGGFATTTNYCKTCHAVHDAGTGSYRLLKNGGYAGAQPNIEVRSSGEGVVAGAGSARANECMYCHDATSGATEFRPYSLGIVATVRGEHSIGATAIPDSTEPMLNRDPVDQANTFGCYDCHSVHGANVMAFWDAGLILRDDPSGDGEKITDVRAGFASNPGNADRDDYQRNNFCSDCHNLNAAWDDNGSDDRAIKTSHVIGPQADGTLEVYGQDLKVAWPKVDLTNNAGGIQNRGCRGCHASNDHGADPQTYGTVSAWPHQTLESKMLLSNGYNGEDPTNDINRAGIITGAADTNRPLYAMDAVCLRCHSGNGAGGVGAGIANFGVGLTF